MANGNGFTLREYTSPVGVAIYPRLNNPDTKYNPEGEYRVRLRFTAEEAEAIREDLAQAFEDAKVEWLNQNPGVTVGKKFQEIPLKPELDKETEEETGFYLLSAKMKASGTYKFGPKAGEAWQRSPFVVDAGLQPIVDSVWGGSELSFTSDIYVYKTAALGFGITLRLVGVQVIKLVKGGASPESRFGAAEGYVQESAPAPSAQSGSAGGDASAF